MAGYPTYVPFALTLYRLSTWKDPMISFATCSLYFLLWFYDALPLALAARILYMLLKHRYVPYPTAEDLRKRRRRTQETEALGDTMDRFSSSWISAAPVLIGGDFSLVDAWNTFRSITKAKKVRAKAAAAEAVSNASSDTLFPPQTAPVKEALKKAKADRKRQEQEEDWRRDIVAFLEGLADVHERVRNIFLWRNPEVSRHYVIVSYSAISRTQF